MKERNENIKQIFATIQDRNPSSKNINI